MARQNSYYTYPVLCDFNDDYVNVQFEAGSNGVLQKGPKKSKLIINFSLDNPTLNKLIHDKKVSIIVKVYCSYTHYREVFNINANNGSDEIILLNQNIDRWVECSTFIVANEDIKDYTNPNFNKDYNNMSFSLSKGCIMGIGAQEKFFIEKDINEFTNINSIVEIESSENDNDPMTVDYSDEKILIILPKKAYNIYFNYSHSFIPIVNSMIVIPALVSVLNEIVDKDLDDDFKAKKWYRVIAKRFTNLKGIPFDFDYIKNNGAFEVLQELFDIPINDAMEMLQKNINGEEHNYEN